ncbi:sensor histidine kinase [Lacihabitans sp. LS3-19]|uniref:sensor histidine kinase n=1 Tax=Lacihabitans sp. LS3-19 TaxID=2487335 RepID=UPI0020CE1F10|nr:histidine kinase [Lacihabitans sp. LS3-19]
MNIETSGKDNPVKGVYKMEYFEETVKVYFRKPIIKGDSVSGVFYRKEKVNLFNEVKNDWIKINGNSFKITELNSGEYVVYVKYQTMSGKTSPEISFILNIQKPWWRTWWFWGASFISLFGLFYGRERFLKFWADEEQRHTKKIVELELRTLQLQMNPHFIFNALNSIQSYVMTHDALTANNYLSKFAQLIRMFLDSSRSKYISLQEEIRMLNLYVEMESLRFEDKFSCEIIVDNDVNKYIEIPTMILQPFVENAINHGLRYKKVKGFLKIHFFYSKQYLICRLEDNGVGRRIAKEIQSKSRKGYKSQGLKITAERLVTYNKINETNIAFSINDLMSSDISDDEDIGTLVEVKFPIN